MSGSTMFLCFREPSMQIAWGDTLPWWKVLTLWLLKGHGLGVFIGKPRIQTKKISVLLPAFYQRLCEGAQELRVNAMYLRNKGWVEWPLQMQMSGVFKALGLKDHKAGLRLLLCFPSLSTFSLLQERGWHNWVRLSEILRGKYNSILIPDGTLWNLFLIQDVPSDIPCIRDLCSQNLECSRAPSP